MRFLILCSFLCGLTVIGCGGEPAYQGPKRFALSGKVTLDGMPVDGGTITFVALAPKQNPTGGSIVKGEYVIPEERGGNIGAYRVEIHWLKPTGEKVLDNDTGEMIDVVNDGIPAKFNTETELKAEIAADKTSFDFNLSSK